MPLPDPIGSCPWPRYEPTGAMLIKTTTFHSLVPQAHGYGHIAYLHSESNFVTWPSSHRFSPIVKINILANMLINMPTFIWRDLFPLPPCCWPPGKKEVSTIFPTNMLKRMEGEKEVWFMVSRNNIPDCLSPKTDWLLGFLLTDCGPAVWPAASHFCCQDVPAMMDCILTLGAI